MKSVGPIPSLFGRYLLFISERYKHQLFRYFHVVERVHHLIISYVLSSFTKNFNIEKIFVVLLCSKMSFFFLCF